MAGINPRTLARFEEIWALLEEGHSKADTARLLDINAAMVTRAVKHAQLIGKDIQKVQPVDPNKVSTLNVSVLLFQHEKDRLLQRFPDKAVLEAKIKSMLFDLIAGEEEQFQQGYDMGYSEAEMVLRPFEPGEVLEFKTPEERKAEKEADKAKVNAYMNELMGWEDDENNDESSAEKKGKEKPQIPDTCGSCGSRELIVFEDDRLYQCDKCLHEDTF